MPSSGKVSMSGEFEGIGFGEQALMHRVRPEPLVDQVGPYDLGCDAGVDFFVGEPPGGVFGEKQLADLPCGIGKRRGDGVPAIEDHGVVGRTLAAAPGCLAATVPPWPRTLVGSLARPLGAVEFGLSVTIAHGKPCLTGSGTRQFGEALKMLAFLPWALVDFAAVLRP